MDWKKLEATYYAESVKAISAWMAQNPEQHAYAFAFHECYRELDGAITFPQLGVNSVERLQQAQGTAEVNYEWNPADWPWLNILTASAALEELESDVHEEANKGTQRQWYKTENKFLNVMVRVAKSLRKPFADSGQTTNDFVVYFDDEEAGLDIVKKCVPTKLFRKHFAEFVSPSDKADHSNADQIQKYLSDPIEYEQQILKLGESAVPGLIVMLGDERNGWVAAFLLRDLGIRTPSVLDALRQRITGKGGVSTSSAQALARLGDLDFLMTLIGNEEKQRDALIGIVSLLKSSAGLALDYRPVEQLLNSGSESVVEIVREELKPGSSLIEIKPTDIDEAIRGLTSEHLIIRQHAVCVLGDRGLGKAAGKIILPTLVERLEDEIANVRRLTLLSLSNWKAAAKPYHEEMRKRLNDKDGNVRSTATYVFE